MHIAFLTTEYPHANMPEGGLGNYIQKTAIELVTRGHHVTVFILSDQCGSQSDDGIELRYVTRTRFHWRLKRNPALANWLQLFELWLNAYKIQREVLAYRRHFPLDIVQTPNYKIPGFTLCHNNKFPLVCRCSSYSPLLRSAHGKQRKLSEAVVDWMEAYQVSNADAAFAPSQFVANIYSNFEAVTLDIIRTPLKISNLQQDDSVYRSLTNQRKYLLYFGTLNRVKGVDILINAIPGILSQDKDLVILFVGRNDPMSDGVKALDLIQSTLGSYWQERRVIYSPPLPRAQLYPIIQHAYGVILPSRVDNYPNACLEALTLGVPVIGTRNSSIDEIVTDGITGFLSENGDIFSLQDAVNRLLVQSQRQRKTMVQAIQKSIVEFINEDRVGMLLQYYQDVISRGNYKS